MKLERKSAFHHWKDVLLSYQIFASKLESCSAFEKSAMLSTHAVFLTGLLNVQSRMVVSFFLPIYSL